MGTDKSKKLSVFIPFICGQNDDMNSTMLAAHLHGPSDLRVAEIPRPGAPGAGEVRLRVTATGVCGSDLHPYATGSIGSTNLDAPLVLGHEFGGVIEAIGANVSNLRVGTRVAVDPAWTCGVCEDCSRGNPNLCRNQKFCGLAPHDGSLCEEILVPSRFCHPIPDSLSDASAALLEPLGIALHATDLARIRVGSSVAILGAGPIGFCLTQTAKLAGANPIYVSEPLDWRLKLVERFGAVPLPPKVEVDVVIEAAWAKESVQTAMELARPGGTVVLVGIPYEDNVSFSHSVPRRKGLTILMSRRMKHTYPRAIRLVESGAVDLEAMITHRFPLERAPEAFALNAKYEEEVVKIIVEGK